MKKLWFIIAILLMWFLSAEKPVEPLSVQSRPAPKKENVLQQETRPSPGKETIPTEQWGVQEYHQIQTERFESPLGRTLVYSFSQDGVPIQGMTIRMREQSDGSLVEEENTYRPISEIPIRREVLEEQAAQLKSQEGRYQFDSLSADSLVIVVREGLENGELAFATSAVDKTRPGTPTQLLVRSDDGKILQKTVGRKEF